MIYNPPYEGGVGEVQMLKDPPAPSSLPPFVRGVSG